MLFRKLLADNPNGTRTAKGCDFLVYSDKLLSRQQSSGLEHCVEALLVAGANANLPDESNKPPLTLATTFGF